MKTATVCFYRFGSICNITLFYHAVKYFILTVFEKKNWSQVVQTQSYNQECLKSNEKFIDYFI